MKIFGYVLIGCIATGMLSAMMFSGMVTTRNIVEINEGMVFRPLDFPPVGNSPAAGSYGWINLSVSILDHFDFSKNLTDNSSRLAHATVNNTHGGTAEMDAYNIEISCLVRLNSSFYSASNSTWMWDSWFRAYVNCTGLTIASERCDLYNVTADSTYCYLYCVVDNGGAGYTLTDSQNVTQCIFNFEGYLQ